MLHMHTQAEADSQRDRADALEQALKQQTTELREKLIKAQTDIDDLRNAMENMVPRCVCAYMHEFVCTLYG
jgi:hypothetical protein